MSALGLVIQREYITRVRKRSFIILTLLMPLLMVALAFVPLWLSTLNDGSVKRVAVIDHTGIYAPLLESTEQYTFEVVGEQEEQEAEQQLGGELFAILQIKMCIRDRGYTDVLSMHQAGIENVVASSGTALTRGQIRMIHRFSENITVLYDGDAAGINAALRGIDLLLEDGMNVKVVLLPEGEDPDSFAKKQNAEQMCIRDSSKA